MAKVKVYLETTVIGFWAGFATVDSKMHEWQEVTRRWLADASDYFDLFVSSLVISECGAGDARAADVRLKYCEKYPSLKSSAEADALADQLISPTALPQKARDDALHVAIATVNGVSFLVTWNCKHLANPVLRKRVEAICQENGYVAPQIVTPHDLLGRSR